MSQVLVLGLALATAAKSAVPQGQVTPPRIVAMTKACAASLSVVKNMVAAVDTPLIFSGWDGAARSDVSDSDYNWSPSPFAENNGVLAPSKLMMHEFMSTDNLRYSAVVNCPSVRAYLTTRRIRFGNGEVMKAVEAQERDVTIVSVSLAAFDSSGRHALLTRGQSSTFGGGGGWVQALVRDRAGHWQEAHIAPTWIS
jgi:hypothetical protein